MTDRLSRVLDASYVDGVEDLDMAALRERRAECQEIEAALSYARRIVQGRLDILHAEALNRGAGKAPSSASELVDRLEKGEMLGDHARPAGFGRLPTSFDPGEASQAYLDEADAVAGPAVIGSLAERSDADVVAAADRLEEVEHSLSARRRQVFDRIDVFQAEIVRRYKTGAADPDSLLTS